MISKPLIHSHGHCQNHALVILPHFLTTTHSELDLEATVPYFNQSNFSEFRRRCLPSLPKLGGGGNRVYFWEARDSFSFKTLLTSSSKIRKLFAAHLNQFIEWEIRGIGSILGRPAQSIISNPKVIPASETETVSTGCLPGWPVNKLHLSIQEDPAGQWDGWNSWLLDLDEVLEAREPVEVVPHNIRILKGHQRGAEWLNHVELRLTEIEQVQGMNRVSKEKLK